jgi:ABC-2 type transport system permease protein
VKTFFTGVGVMFSLEMRQRVRGLAWYILLGVFFLLVVIVTILLTVADHLYAMTGGRTEQSEAASAIFSTIIYFVLLLGVLVAPALSGNAINGDRSAGTLATTQVTLISGWQIIFGKFLAAWVTGLAFLVVALPCVIYTIFVGGLGISTIAVSVVILAVELGVVAAIGVGLSGLIPKPLFSIVVTYLAVATLCIGTLIVFTLGGLVIETPTTTVYYSSTQTDSSGDSIHCTYASSDTEPTPRFDLVWGALVANPFVILADAVPTTYDSHGEPSDLFGEIKLGVRSAQITPARHVVENDCSANEYDGPNARHIIDTTAPGWLVGLGIQLVLAAAALVGAGLATRTPSGRLPRDSRIA